MFSLREFRNSGEKKQKTMDGTHLGAVRVKNAVILNVPLCNVTSTRVSMVVLDKVGICEEPIN